LFCARVQVLLRRQHGRKIPGSEIVLQQGDAERGVCCGDALAQKIDLFAPLQEARQTVLDLLLRFSTVFW